MTSDAALVISGPALAVFTALLGTVAGALGLIFKAYQTAMADRIVAVERRAELAEAMVWRLLNVGEKTADIAERALPGRTR